LCPSGGAHGYVNQMADTPILPAHIEDTVRSIAELHVQHYRETSLYQRIIDGLTAQVGRPAFVGVITSVIALWVGCNLLLPQLHALPFDPAPFYWLQGLVTTTALYIAVLILTTQRRENLLAEHRAQLTLEISMVNEQKTAKLIEMIEQLRRDNPMIENHLDPEAIAMSRPADPQAMFEAIRETHQEMLADEAGSPAP
jgi:uncharacterized membrane protein